MTQPWVDARARSPMDRVPTATRLGKLLGSLGVRDRLDRKIRSRHRSMAQDLAQHAAWKG